MGMMGFIKGVANVCLSGSHCEQVLNVLHRKGVDFKRLNRLDAQRVSFSVQEKNLKIIEQVCRDYHTEWSVEHLSSLRHQTKKYIKRWGIAAGFLGAVVILAIFNCFIWDVRVSGCDEKTTAADVLAQFERLGIGVGSYRFGKDISMIENQFLLDNDEVVWVSVNMRFTTAYIELREYRGAQIYDFTTPSDIYAVRDGQIVSMVVSSGTRLVNVGDSVCAGDKLVSREYIDRYGQTILVPSIAIIKAKTQREIEVKVALREQNHVATGRKKTYFTLSLFNFKIPLYFKENISYNRYDTTESVSRLKLGKNFALPFSLQKITYTEVTVQTVDKEPPSAKISALALLEQKEKEQFSDAEILSENLKELTEDGYLVLRATYQVIEDIGVVIGE